MTTQAGFRGDNSLVKELNTRIVMAMIDEEQPISRVDIVRRTNLGRSTVSMIVSRLIAMGLVVEEGGGEYTGGRRPVLLRIKPGSRFIAGVHVDDSGEVLGALYDLTGNVVKEGTSFCLEQERLPQVLLDVVNELVSDDDSKSKLVGVGLALPGIVDSENGMILTAVNPGWSNVQAGALVSSEYNVLVLCENATGAAAWAEKVLGGARDCQSLVYIKIASTVGGGIVLNGRLHRGLRGSTGEFGHVAITDQGVSCKCGRKGCLESLVSNGAIYGELTRSHPALVKDWNITEANCATVLLRLAGNGDTNARAIVTQLVAHCARAIANFINILGPEVVIVEAPLFESDFTWDLLCEAVQSEVLPPPRGTVRIIRPSLGERACLLGVVNLVKRALLSSTALGEGLSGPQPGIEGRSVVWRGDTRKQQGAQQTSCWPRGLT